MQNPQCPKCGSMMKLQTARKGKYAGRQFYGCSRYPTCKGIVNIENTERNNGATSTSLPIIPSTRHLLPRNFVVRPRFQGYQVRFFESVALPEAILEMLIDGEISDNTLRAFAQWRIDYPPPSEPPTWIERERQLFSVAEKILSRGRLTLCSPQLEESLRRKFFDGSNKLEANVLSDEVLLWSTDNINSDFWLDSPAEKIFYTDYLASRYGSAFLRWVCPQVELTSLIPTYSSIQEVGRVDFLICHPTGTPIVVEIDGESHSKKKELDSLRDAALTKEGFKVVRIPSKEIETLSGDNLSLLEGLLSFEKRRPNENLLHNQKATKLIHAVRVSHQIQLSVLQAIQAGFLTLSDSSNWNLSSDINETGLFDNGESLFLLKSSIQDLLRLIENLGHLYSLRLGNGIPKVALSSGSQGIHISFTGETHLFLPTLLVHNVSLPIHVANSVFATSPAILDAPSEKTLEYFLNYIFRKPSFWEGQLDAISRTLQGKDSIVLLPTGAGKSIAFQLASFLLPGRAIVIDPIISLMEDQIDNLQSVGIDRTIAITSQITDPEDRSRVLTLFGQGEYLFAYIAPERFQTVEFREALRTLTTHSPISLIAVDEAHCVSEWGHDFRTAYLNIGRTSRTYCESNGVTPPLIALTGTASRAVLKDVQRELHIEDFEAIITPKSFDRPELQFHIFSSSSAEKSARLLGYLGQTLPSKFSVSPASFFQPNAKSTFSGLVFCPHVNGEYGVVEISDRIKSNLNVPTGFYSGKEPKFYSGYGWGFAKQAIARQFKHNQLPLLVCTKAFGMGIDKPNIRFTLHFGIPPSIESFYQEAGRAGRDRKTAHCCILVSVDDPERAKRLLDPNTKPEDLSTIIQSTRWDDNDDVTRALFFQTKAFPGIAAEKSRVEKVIRAFPNLFTKSSRSVKFSDLERNEAEKALHRLLVLGVISDYTINYNTEEFTVQLAGVSKETIIETYGKYVAGYLGARRQAEVEKSTRLLRLPLAEFALEMVVLLLRFIYDVIERGRRRALSEMLLAATVSPTDASIRQRILHYLEATQYSEALEAIIAEADAGLERTRDAFDAVRSPNEAAELRGQVARYLESYPDHPGLLMLRALSEVFCRDKNPDIAKQNFVAAIDSAEENYSVNRSKLFEFLVWALNRLAEREGRLAEELLTDALSKYPERTLARNLINKMPTSLSVPAAWFLINRLVVNSRKLISA